MCLLCPQRDNKQLRESVMRLESENDNLAQELVLSKVTLRQEMDRVSVFFCFQLRQISLVGSAARREDRHSE